MSLFIVITITLALLLLGTRQLRMHRRSGILAGKVVFVRPVLSPAGLLPAKVAEQLCRDLRMTGAECTVAPFNGRLKPCQYALTLEVKWKRIPDTEDSYSVHTVSTLQDSENVNHFSLELVLDRMPSKGLDLISRCVVQQLIPHLRSKVPAASASAVSR